jgi:hypothetical protein
MLDKPKFDIDHYYNNDYYNNDDYNNHYYNNHYYYNHNYHDCDFFDYYDYNLDLFNTLKGITKEFFSINYSIESYVNPEDCLPFKTAKNCEIINCQNIFENIKIDIGPNLLIIITPNRNANKIDCIEDVRNDTNPNYTKFFFGFHSNMDIYVQNTKLKELPSRRKLQSLPTSIEELKLSQDPIKIKFKGTRKPLLVSQENLTKWIKVSTDELDIYLTIVETPYPKNYIVHKCNQNNKANSVENLNNFNKKSLRKNLSINSNVRSSGLPCYSTNARSHKPFDCRISNKYLIVNKQ